MLWGDMSEPTRTSTPRSGGAGRPLLWLVLLLSLALLSFVTVSAVRANPIYSDRDTHGISKYLFLEECKELVQDTAKLSVGAMGQAVPLKTLVEQSRPLAAGERLGTSLEVESTQLVRAVQTVDAGGWTLSGLPVTINILKGSASTPLGQLPLECRHDKKTGKTTAQLQLPGQ